MSAATCHIVKGAYADCVQLALGVLAIGSLVVKRYVEKPRRSWKVWALDVSKQAAGGLFAHALNLLLALFLSYASAGHDKYLFNFTVDTTIGVFYAYLLLQVVEWAAHRWHLPRLQHSGDYGRRVDYKKWGAQLGSWLLIIFITKLTLGLIVYGLDRPISDMVVTISSAFDGNRKLELWIAMIVGPCILNFLQFWIQDTFLKKKKRGSRWRKSGTVNGVREHRGDSAASGSSTASTMSDLLLPVEPPLSNASSKFNRFDSSTRSLLIQPGSYGTVELP